MLRIESEMDGPRKILRLIGRVRSDCIEELRQRIQTEAPTCSTWRRLISLIFSQFVSCAIAKTGKSNCEIVRHTSWSGFAASALKAERDEGSPKTQQSLKH